MNLEKKFQGVFSSYYAVIMIYENVSVYFSACSLAKINVENMTKMKILSILM